MGTGGTAAMTASKSPCSTSDVPVRANFKDEGGGTCIEGTECGSEVVNPHSRQTLAKSAEAASECSRGSLLITQSWLEDARPNAVILKAHQHIPISSRK